MENIELLADSRILDLLGSRLSEHRLARNLTQAELAKTAGVSKRTVERLEAGDSTQLTNFIRILRALKLLGGLESLVPPPLPSPIEQLKLQGRRRQRASSVRESPVSAKAWTWDDES